MTTYEANALRHIHSLASYHAVVGGIHFAGVVTVRATPRSLKATRQRNLHGLHVGAYSVGITRICLQAHMWKHTLVDIATLNRLR
jgi:hypothetical protein